jgi:hypothetical protein
MASPKTRITQNPVVLEGFQAIFKPSKFGYTLSTVIGDELLQMLEEDRAESLGWAETKLKNPKRATLKPEPWEEVAPGKYKVKFSWSDETKPPVVDSEGTLITDEDTPLFSGSKVKIAFRQKPYILKDGVTYGTTLKLQGIQVVDLAGSGGGAANLDGVEVAALFGRTAGYKVGEPNVTPAQDIDEDDF